MNRRHQEILSNGSRYNSISMRHVNVRWYMIAKRQSKFLEDVFIWGCFFWNLKREKAVLSNKLHSGLIIIIILVRTGVAFI